MSGRRIGSTLLLVAVLLSAAWMGIRPADAAQAANHAGLVVVFGDGRVAVRVVAFAEETISGVDLLQRSGLEVALTANLGGGVALCAVEGVGCPPTPQDCFCQCRGGDCRYWSYFHLEGGSWVYASVGAAGRVLQDGDVDGWVWGDGRTPPPLLTWDEIWALAGAVTPAATPPEASAAPVPPRPAATPPSVAAVPPSTTGALPTAVPATASGGPLPGAAERVASSPSALPVTAASSLPVSPTSLPAASASVLPWVSPSPTRTQVSGGQGGAYGAIAFGGTALLLVGLWFWVRRRG